MACAILINGAVGIRPGQKAHVSFGLPLAQCRAVRVSDGNQRQRLKQCDRSIGDSLTAAYQ